MSGPNCQVSVIFNIPVPMQKVCPNPKANEVQLKKSNTVKIRIYFREKVVMQAKDVDLIKQMRKQLSSFNPYTGNETGAG